VSTSLTFRHADGTSYGSVLDPHTTATHADAFRALRGLGFRETETRAALARIRVQPDLLGAPIEKLLREALAFLTPCGRGPSNERRL